MSKKWLWVMIVASGLLMLAAIAYGADQPLKGPECVYQYSGARPVPCGTDGAPPGASGPWCAEIPKEFSYGVYQNIVDKVADRCHLAPAGREWEFNDGSMVRPFVDDSGSLIVFSLREHRVIAVKVIAKRR
jgi:hypothetical protein